MPVPQETRNLSFPDPGVHGPGPLGIALQVIGILLISLTIGLAAVAGFGGLKEGGLGLPDLGGRTPRKETGAAWRRRPAAAP